jgi:hypothetical protein
MSPIIYLALVFIFFAIGAYILAKEEVSAKKKLLSSRERY